MPRLGVLEVCSSISLSGQRRHHSFVEDDLVLAVTGRCALVDRLGVGGGRIKTGLDQLLLWKFWRPARRRLRFSEMRLCWRSLTSDGTWRRLLTRRVARRYLDACIVLVVFVSYLTYKWFFYLPHDYKQNLSFQIKYDTTFCLDINLNPGRVTPCIR